MEKFKNFLKKVSILMVALMLFTVPNLQVYSYMGNYSNQSSALTATTYNSTTLAEEEAAWFQAAAAAIASAYCAGYAIGTLAHHVYDALDGHEIALANNDLIEHNALDFTKFDN